ncbi:MAG TPA: LuxR C-terminal-related transcriptional regulator, partial [Solirubrobacteraceae bacterium]|nr:LuxR C-terminal-related transcriptional regulator [Solirubrobacteraceae bacterium]
EAERDLAYVVLGDLFEDVLGDVLPALPAPRRRALEAALLVDQAPEFPVDRRALGVAVRGALQALAARAPLVVAVDDEQWVDAASASVLQFAFRRLREERVLLLLARRLDATSEALGLEEAVDPQAVECLTVGPLSMGVLQLLLKRRLGRTVARPTLVRILEVSGGNPFYALELARGLGARRAIRVMTEPLPIPESLERLVGTRLERLPSMTREALLLVAAHGRPSSALLRAAGVAPRALEPAVGGHVVERSDGVTRFTHPLLASVLYQSASREERQRAHGRLSGIVDDPVDRGRHVALATDEPDEAVASALDECADLAGARGTTLAAAELRDHALRLTPPDALDRRHSRALAAARAYLEAGEAHRAGVLAGDLLERAQAGTPRAEALVLMSDIENVPNLERAIALRRAALDAADAQPALQASIHGWLANAVRLSEGLGAADRHARASLALAERIGDQVLRAEALSILSVLRFNAGEPDALALAEEALGLLAASGRSERRFEASLGLVHVLTWSAQFDRARALLETLCRKLRDRDEAALSDALWFLSLVELGAGRLAVAADHADRQREIHRQYSVDEQEDPLAIWPVARIAAHRGELDRARELAERSRASARDRPQVLAGQEGVLGLVAAWSDRQLDAVAHFSRAEEARYGAGVRAPSTYWWRAEYVEALLELGRIDAALDLLGAWQSDATRLGLDWVLAHVARCRGLVAAARGEIEAASALLAQAIARHEAVGDPFGRARGLLALGIVRRRGRQKRAAREAIAAALADFEAIGAAGWAARARAELGRIGGRTREEGLTAAERRVAALVAEGRTNREVAATLFLGERTVETHLSHVYAKLGVRSRTELARTFRADQQGSGELTIPS